MRVKGACVGAADQHKYRSTGQLHETGKKRRELPCGTAAPRTRVLVHGRRAARARDNGIVPAGVYGIVAHGAEVWEIGRDVFPEERYVCFARPVGDDLPIGVIGIHTGFHMIAHNGPNNLGACVSTRRRDATTSSIKRAMTSFLSQAPMVTTRGH